MASDAGSALTDDDASEIRSEIGPWAIVPVWVLDLELTPAEITTYIALRSFADRGRQAHPKVRTIAARAHLNPKTVEKALARFRELDLITTERRYRDEDCREIAGCIYTMRDNPPPVRPAGTPPPGGGYPPAEPRVPPRQAAGAIRDQRTDQGTVGDASADAPAQLTLSTSEKVTPIDRARKAPSRDKKPARSLPDDFTVTDQMYEWAAKKDVSRAVTDHQTEQFKDYHLAKGSTFDDWVAAWRMWINKAIAFAAQRSAPLAAPPTRRPTGSMNVEGW